MRAASTRGGGAVSAAVLGGLVAVVGCSGAPRADALRSSIVLNNQAASALRAEQARHQAALRADIARRSASCRALAPEGQPACFQQATQEALAAAAPDQARLTELALLQRSAAAALKAARQCRADRLPCESEHVVEAASPLAQARAGLHLGDDEGGGAGPGAEDGVDAGGGEEP